MLDISLDIRYPVPAMATVAVLSWWKNMDGFTLLELLALVLDVEELAFLPSLQKYRAMKIGLLSTRNDTFVDIM